jgi:tetratricopeptide (TPR) repeat protein
MMSINPSQKKIFGYFVIIILIIFGTRTIIRNTNFYDAITLYSHDIQIQDNFDLENNLGVDLQLVNRNAEALAHFKKSVALYPFETNLSNLSTMYAVTGNLQKAKEYSLQALSTKHYSYSQIPHKHDQVTYERYAFVLIKLHENEQAKSFLLSGLSDYSNAGTLWLLLSVAEYNAHNKEKALSYLLKAKTSLPQGGTDYVYNQIMNNQPIELR